MGMVWCGTVSKQLSVKIVSLIEHRSCINHGKRRQK